MPCVLTRLSHEVEFVFGLPSNVPVTDLRACASAGMNECLAKTSDWPRLADAISRYAARHGAPEAGIAATRQAIAAAGITV